MNSLILGDSAQKLKELPDNSVDVICTDPPYFLINDSGQGFMGKAWDGILHLWNYLWLDNTFAEFAERFFTAVRVEPSTEEDGTVPVSASTEPRTANKNANAPSATNNSPLSPVLKNDFAHALVLTKHELSDLLQETSFGHIALKLQSGASDNAKFVIPLSLLKRKLTDAVAVSALNALTKQTCAGRETLLTLTDAAKISGAIAVTIGTKSAAQSMNEIAGLASFATSTVAAEKFSATTVSPTDKAALMKCLTLLLFALSATRSSRETQYSLIDNFFTVVWRECLRVLKPGAFAFVCMTPRQDIMSRAMLSMERAGFSTNFTSIFWTYASGFPKAMNIGKMVDKRLGHERPRIEGGAGTPGNTFPLKPEAISPEAISPEAISLNGSYGGFQPKPAVEVIIVAMKPLSEKTFVDQAMKNGKGVTWLDDCRIPAQENYTINTFDNGAKPFGDAVGETFTSRQEERGRFPANLLVSDDVLNDGRNIKGATSNGRKNAGGYHRNYGNLPQVEGYGDTGSYSRFFSLDAWWTEAEKKLPERVRKVLPFMIVPKASKREKNEGLQGFADHKPMNYGGNKGFGATYPDGTLRPKNPDKNHHPTVKPLQLMCYLVTLGSRQGDTVLDPFLGSGTTAIAAKLLNRRYIGIEREKEYIDIAKARLDATPNTLFQAETR